MALLICWSVFCTTQKNQQNAITGFRKWSHFAKCWKGNWWKLTTFHFCRSLTLSPPPCLAPFFSRLENINPEETDMVSPLENFMWSCRFFSIPLQWDCVILENDLNKQKIGNTAYIKFKFYSLFKVRHKKPFNKNQMMNVNMEETWTWSLPSFFVLLIKP